MTAEENFSFSDTYNPNYQVVKFSQAYTNVTRIEMFVGNIKSGSVNQYQLYITDIEFYGD